MLIMCLFLCADEDDDGECRTVPLTPLASFFSDEDSLREQKRKKPKKMKEGKIPKVKKRKKEVRSRSNLGLGQNRLVNLAPPPPGVLTPMGFSCQRCVSAAGRPLFPKRKALGQLGPKEGGLAVVSASVSCGRVVEVYLSRRWRC